MKITSQVFQAYLKCNTKCWLYSLGEKGKGNEYADWLRDRNDSYYNLGVKRLFEGLPQSQYDSPVAYADFRIGRWRLAAGVVVECAFRHGRSCGSKDLLNLTNLTNGSQAHPSAFLDDAGVILATHLPAVERLGSGPKRKLQYIPIRFIFRNKITNDDRLLLGFDAFVLSAALGYRVERAKIIRGDDYRTLNIKTTTLLIKVRNRIEKIMPILISPSPPQIILSRNCVECEFQSACRQKAAEKDELTLLQGMTPKEREINHKKGIFTVNQLSYTFRPRRRPKSLRGRRDKYHHSLKALAIREKKIHVLGNPDFKIDGTPVFLDVEALPDRGFYYLIGLRIKNESSIDQYSLWADRFDDEEVIWRQFLDILCSVERPTLIHYGSFETTFFRDMTKRYSKVPEGSPAANAIESAVNLLSVIFGQIYFPCFSNGLKDISRYLGFEWSEPNVSGIQTIIWRETWHDSHEESLKQRLITYNSEDCEAICRVTDCLNNLSSHISDASNTSAAEFIRADFLPSVRPFRFKKINFAFPELEAINNAAYWNYQKEHLLLRPNDSIRKSAQNVAKRKKVKPNPKPNKVVSFPAPLQCPTCGKTKIYKHQAYTKTFLDLKCNSSGVKRWITKYLYCRFRCAACKTVFWGSVLPWQRSEKFGINLKAMSIYLNIGLRIPQQRVAVFFNEILGFNISRAVPNRIKHLAATYYNPTVEKLMKKIIRGNLIHADETKVHLKGKTGYVWAFSNMGEVVYLYAPNREGNWVLELLKEFKGVLVSDFYAVYDSIGCPQQKCLIHLIRDMNEDLLKEPFNDEMKSLVADFALLVMPIIETVDRFGLKARFFRKHKKHVTRFFKKLLRQDFRSDPAIKCKVRLLKNQGQLFTFLDYDNVPWNNNNAEHAVKAFVYVRRDLSGISTENGIRDYLNLLSLCETCRIRGLSFLDFLRSGEIDIDVFAQNQQRPRINEKLHSS
jgi:predicted RecB family nuclease